MAMIKLSDFVANFLAEQGIKHAFVVAGGASLHLIHSVKNQRGLNYICPQHEQGGAMGADGYARVSRNMGISIATSGPGATNLVTGICCSYYDSVPVIYITGQVSTLRMKGSVKIRQMGFQETDIISICRSITKYAVQINDPKKIRFELEKACYLAKEGRPGPVLIDIPDDLQRVQIDSSDLEAFYPNKTEVDFKEIEKQVDQIIELLNTVERPILILGWGVRLSFADSAVMEMIHNLGIPVTPTWAVADFLPADHPLLVGTFGTHGTRYANFAVQNADLIISIGSRLDTKATGSPMSSFARGARKIVVDIDANELDKFSKFGLKMDILVQADAKRFAEICNKKIDKKMGYRFVDWLKRISFWKKQYPICLPSYYKEEEINPYVFVKILSRECKEGDQLFVDTGCAVAWMMQAFEFKARQRLYHDCNNTAMGWALPASIGGCFALDGGDTICIAGDGSLLMTIQELATIIKHQLPIKIFLINNDGFSMIRQTQDQWLGGQYLASSFEGGLSKIDFVRVAESFGFETLTVARNRDLHRSIQKVLQNEGPFFCNVVINNTHRVVPQVKFGRPNEDADPLLDRKEFLSNMIVSPLDVSV